MYVLAPNTQILYRELSNRDKQSHTLVSWSHGSCFLSAERCHGFSRVGEIFGDRNGGRKLARRRDVRAEAFWPDLTRPSTVEMEPINDCDQFDRILARAQELSQPIIVDWMASWCRKCIYLKPKLEKLAAEYDTLIKFYYVDVNKVPQALVKRGNISKMPTIQLWINGEKKDEVIGGHKGWLVIEEVREMISKFV